MNIAEAGDLFALAPLLIAFPILGLVINILFGKRLSERWVGGIASAAVALSFVVALIQWAALQSAADGTRVLVADWISIGTLNTSWALKIDSLSVVMALLVTGVSTLIHIYAIGYMHEDVRLQGDPGRFTRFFIYFNLFVAAMMVLITADNYLMMFVGWEGVGLCSYLLIGFWYEKGKDGIGNAIAGTKAFIINRIGDIGFLIAMFLIFWTFGSLQFDEVFQAAEGAETKVLTLITLFLLLGVTGKSAQIPLFAWLPDAMAGPTPVSALIHAATMVTAGIYLIVRSSVLFTLAPATSSLVALIGAITALFAASIAIAQFDIKRVLAYSTISQLGFMVAAAGLGAYVAAIFHLIAHAFFKALLFLSSGSVIQGVEHGLHQSGDNADPDQHAFDPQDMRNMGGLRSRMKITFWVYLVGGLALAGIPPLSGFFSKDEILADASKNNFLIYVLLALAAIFTAFYVGRQIVMVFFGEPRSDAAAQAKENPALMTVPLLALAVLAAFGGLLNLPSPQTLSNWLGLTLEHVEKSEFNPTVALLSTLFALGAIAVAWRVYSGRKDAQEPLRGILGPLFSIWENKYWVDEFYDWLVIRRYKTISYVLAEIVDWRFWHDWVHDTLLARTFRRSARWLATGFDLSVIDGTANNLARLIQETAKRLRILQTGYVRNYALSILVGLLILMSYILIQLSS